MPCRSAYEDTHYFTDDVSDPVDVRAHRLMDQLFREYSTELMHHLYGHLAIRFYDEKMPEQYDTKQYNISVYEYVGYSNNGDIAYGDTVEEVIDRLEKEKKWREDNKVKTQKLRRNKL